MRSLIIAAVVIVCGIEFGGMAVDSFFDHARGEAAALQQQIDVKREY